MDAKYRYAKKNYDRVTIMLPHGAQEQIKAAAAAEGKSVNRYVLEALEVKSGMKLTLDNALPWIKAK